MKIKSNPHPARDGENIGINNEMGLISDIVLPDW